MTESNSGLTRRKSAAANGPAQKKGAGAGAGTGAAAAAERREGVRGDKVFAARDSRLTTLVAESPHLRTVYNIFVAVLLLLLINTLLSDFVHFGKINVGLQLIKAGFWSQAGRVARLWLLQLATALAAYPGFRLWAAGRCALGHKPSLGSRCWSAAAVVGYVALQLTLLGVSTRSLFRAPLPVASGTIITLEMLRHSMKVHAFVRSCAGRAASPPPPSCYLYFLFAPTLLYRDAYPRTKNIRWNKVLYHLMEVGGVIFYMAFIVETFVIPSWVDFGKQEVFAAEWVARHLFSHMLLGMVSFLCGFYSVLHAWLNAAAELTTFADRLFYEEWWLCSRFGTYYRAWNGPVYEWLHAHIYREVAPRAGRGAALLAVFAVSALAHELAIALTLGFFYPVLLLMFGVFGMLLVPLTSALGHRLPHLLNMFMWMSFFMGNGLLWMLYPMEYFARINCPPSENDSWFVPKSWSCPSIQVKPDWSFENPFT